MDSYGKFKKQWRSLQKIYAYIKHQQNINLKPPIYQWKFI